MPETKETSYRFKRRDVLAGGMALAAAGWAGPSLAQRNPRTLLKGGSIISLDPVIGDFARADVLMEGTHIKAVGPNLAVEGAEIVDCSRMVVMPGFVDTHRHMWEGVLRHDLPDATIAEYVAIELMKTGPLMRPDDVRLGNLISALSALDAGVTCVFDYSHIQNTPAHTDAAITGLRESGIRAVFGYGTPQLGGKRWWQDTSHAYPGDIKRLRKEYFASDDQLLTLALAPNSLTTGPLDICLREMTPAREVGARITAHASGRGGGAGLISALHAQGFLKNDMTYVHCLDLKPEEWDMIRDTGGHVSIAAQIEMQMGQGATPPVQIALDHGMRPSLSVDVETSVPGDLFTQMRSVLALQRLGIFERRAKGEQNLPKLITARDVLEFATIEGARANGLEKKTGSLTPGKEADIILLDKDRINVMPVVDALGAVVTGMDTSNVDSVYVAGRAVKQGGKLIGVDLPRLKAQVEATQAYILARRA